MKRKFLSLFLSVFTLVVCAQGFKQTYPYAVADDKMVVSDFVEFADYSSEQVFVNSLLYAIDQVPRALESIEQIDFEAKRFIVKQQMDSKEYESDGTSYKCIMQFQVADNILSFLSRDISLDAKAFLNEFRTTPFERLNPEKKPKHKAFMEEFLSIHAKYLNKMFAFIRTNSYMPITHWDEIKAGELVKGMNETECKLLCGKPINIRNTGSKIRWMFNNDFIVFFENGVITSIIQ